jgi:ParB-like chromosome segregation protein Spo0J
MTTDTAQIELIPINDIKIAGERRPLNKKKVRTLAKSIHRLGLRNPITVWRNEDGGADLVAGLHRLEAVKSLGRKKIETIVMEGSKTQVRMWTIAENLHRHGLTKLERAESIDEWKRLLKKLKVDGAVSGPGGRQPKDQGINKTAKALNLSREDVRRSEKVAKICKRAKRLAAKKGLDNNQAALLKVAAESTPDAQVKKVRELAKKAEVKRSSSLSPDDSTQLKSLKRAFIIACSNSLFFSRPLRSKIVSRIAGSPIQGIIALLAMALRSTAVMRSLYALSGSVSLVPTEMTNSCGLNRDPIRRKSAAQSTECSCNRPVLSFVKFATSRRALMQLSCATSRVTPSQYPPATESPTKAILSFGCVSLMARPVSAKHVTADAMDSAMAPLIKGRTLRRLCCNGMRFPTPQRLPSKRATYNLCATFSRSYSIYVSLDADAVCRSCPPTMAPAGMVTTCAGVVLWLGQNNQPCESKLCASLASVGKGASDRKPAGLIK